MITSSFDKSKPLIQPSDIYKDSRCKVKCKTCIVTFSYHVMDEVLDKYDYEIVGFAGTANGKIHIFYLKELDVLFFMSPIGAAVAATILEEVAYVTGVKNFIYFGSCGTLVKEAIGKIIIPIKSYRDEGVSYHYMPNSDYIDITNYELIEKVCENNKLKFIKGCNWTTDAIYRETINNVEKRRNDGCISVDMEASGLQAVANYLKVNLYILFFSGDVLSEEWERGDLGGEREKEKQLFSFDVAIMIQKEIEK